MIGTLRETAGALNELARVAREGHRARALALRRVARARPRADLQHIMADVVFGRVAKPREALRTCVKSISVSGASDIATPSSWRRVDGVEVDGKIQHERAVKC